MIDPDLDPTTAPFWSGLAARELLVQTCLRCDAAQLYPRPFCLACDGDELSWVPSQGTGIVYSVTTVRVASIPELEPPYQVAIVELEEGPRLLARLAGEPCEIGTTVGIDWDGDGVPGIVFRAQVV